MEFRVSWRATHPNSGHFAARHGQLLFAVPTLPLPRATALDTLIDMGSLGMLPNGEDMLERELQELSAANAVEEELVLLKAGYAQ